MVGIHLPPLYQIPLSLIWWNEALGLLCVLLGIILNLQCFYSLSNTLWQKPCVSCCLLYFSIQWRLTSDHIGVLSCVHFLLWSIKLSPVVFLSLFFCSFLCFLLFLCSLVCFHHSTWNASILSYVSTKMRRVTCKILTLAISIDNWWRWTCKAMALTADSKIALHPRFVTSKPWPFYKTLHWAVSYKTFLHWV